MTRKQDLPRVVHLRKKHGIALMDMCVGPNTPFRMMKHEHAAFAHALAMDPTPKAIYLSTIVRWLQTRAMRHEDARRVRTLLAAFHERKRHLPAERRDIGRYGTPGDLSEVLGILQPAVLQDVPEEILKESPMVASGPDWAIFAARSQDAAEWWADSTDWCTRHPEKAAEYLHNGPLHVLRAKGEKYQFHVRSGQFVDRYDRIVRAPSRLSRDCLEAILAIVRSEPGFRPAEIEGAIYEEMARRGEEAPEGQVFFWRDDAYASNDAMLHPATLGGLGSIISRRRDGTAWSPADTTTLTTLVEDLDRGSVVLDFLRTGADIALEDSTDLDRGTFITSMETSLLKRWLMPGCDFIRIVLVDGCRILLWHVPSMDGSPERFEAVDVDGPAGGRAFRFLNAEELLELPARFGRAVNKLCNPVSVSLPMLRLLDPDRMSPAELVMWRSLTGRQRMIDRLLHRRASELDVIAGARLCFGDEHAASVVRLVGAVEADGRHRIRRLRVDDEPRPSDLHAVMDVPNAGVLLAALEDFRVTGELLDRLIDAGRFEAICVAPARLLTLERLQRAARRHAKAPAPFRPAMSGRTMSLASYRALSELYASSDTRAFAESLGISGFISTYIDTKAPSMGREPAFERAFASLPANASLDDKIARIRESGDGEAHAALARIFDDVPPVGLPWSMALDALRKDLRGIDDVLVSLRKGDWGGDTEKRMAELRLVPGAVSRINPSLWTRYLGPLLRRRTRCRI